MVSIVVASLVVSPLVVGLSPSAPSIASVIARFTAMLSRKRTSLFVGWTALRDMDALRRELYEFKIRTDNIISQADEAQRAYVNARKTLERARR